jgi:hypothetical protein
MDSTVLILTNASLMIHAAQTVHVTTHMVHSLVSVTLDTKEMDSTVQTSTSATLTPTVATLMVFVLIPLDHSSVLVTLDTKVMDSTVPISMNVRSTPMDVM